MHKFLEVEIGGEGIEYTGGGCHQHFLNGSSQTTDIAQEMNKDSMLLHCNATPGGSEHYYWWHIRRLGFRNCSNFGTHPYSCWDCVGKDCSAMASPGVCFEGIETSNHVKGQIIFACGIQAGLTDLNTCYIGAKITDDEIIESYISK